MDSLQLRSLFERNVHQVVIDSGSVALRDSVVPAQYEPKISTLVISENLSDGDMIRASLAALLHHEYKHSKVSLTVFASKAMAEREYRHLSNEDIRFLKKFIEDRIFQQRFTF